MNAKLKIFTWQKIPVYLHWSFPLIFLYAFYIGTKEGFGTNATLWLMGFFATLFACVLLHEYGHALAARRYGIETEDIILTPIGGIARLHGMPEKPIQEFIVAIAGPLVNVVIAIVLFIAGKTLFFDPVQAESFNYYLTSPDIRMTSMAMFLPQVIITNISLFVFNLIPAFPMDGGRIFRSLLAMKLGRVRATKIASILGQVFAVGFVVGGFYLEAYTLMLIGFFIFNTARAEYFQVRNSNIFSSFTARDMVRRNFTKLFTNDWMQHAASMLKQGHEQHFLVYDFNGLVGTLFEASIIDAIKKSDWSAPVEQYMGPVAIALSMDTPLHHIYHLLTQEKVPIITITDDFNSVIGVIDLRSIDYFMQLQTKLGKT